MKILALGDFHGEFPKNLNKIINKEKIELVVSNGDYSPFLMRKLFFKHVFAQEVRQGLWDFIGKKKYKELQIKDNIIVKRLFEKINNLPVPVLTVFGNVDHTKGIHDTFDINDKRFELENKWKWANQDFYINYLKRCKNMTRIDYNPVKIGGYIFVGMNGHSFPGHIKSKSFKKSKKKLDNIFRKYKKENKEGKIIFVSHNIAHGTKLDKITSKGADKIVKNKHYGSYLARKIVNQFQPALHIGGHIHEGRGTQKLGKTLCVNPGSIHEGQMCVIELKDKKIKVRFI